MAAIYNQKCHVNQPICKYVVSRYAKWDSFELYLTLLIRFMSYDPNQKIQDGRQIQNVRHFTCKLYVIMDI